VNSWTRGDTEGNIGAEGGFMKFTSDGSWSSMSNSSHSRASSSGGGGCEESFMEEDMMMGWMSGKGQTGFSLLL